MPRHRKEHVPLYRVRRRAENAARRTPVHAAVRAPASEPIGPVEAVEASTTVPLPAFRRRLFQLTSPAGPAALGGANPVVRAARRLMVTPWFAVATGFVVAAGLWIYSPHTELNIPNGAVGRIPCKSDGCGIASPKNPRNAAGGSLLPMTGSVGKIPTRHAASPGPKFGYRVIWQSQGRFSLLMTVSGKHVPSSWRLAFTLPGDQVTSVQGASWQPSGPYRGMATWPALDSPWQAGGQTSYTGDHYSSRTSRRGDSFIISGLGVPTTPVDCSFDGAKCQFSILDSSWPTAGG